MIHKNLTPFFWGPKATAVQPPQVDMALCIRGTFRLAPGKPLEVIEDPIEQGYMSGDVWADEDTEQKGALVHTNDFADAKPKADLLLKGTCHPPRGADTACDVRFGVGSWSKTLRVLGPRTFKPGLLFGGSTSDPEPFTHMPLTWANAYGGPGYDLNPGGKGFASSELPNVVYPDKPVDKQGKKGIVPAGFGPISPRWPQRAKKVGKKYGAKWRATRFPFYSVDFDWTHFNAAPDDQQLNAYLKGDEELSFKNLHPDTPNWKVKLPALRVRAFVKTDDDKVHEPHVRLDTLYADLDDGKLYLTWRGLAPIRELDMTDVVVVLIASEPLASEPLPVEHYHRLLAEFEADPVGLNDAFPPGFLEAAQTLEAAELAELHGTPKPDLKAAAKRLPPGCPIPPWFFAAVDGDPDPLGVKARMPPAFFSDDPLGLRETLPPFLAEAKSRKEYLEGIKAKKDDPEALVGELEKLAELKPPEERPAFLAQLDELKASLAQAKEHGGPEALTPPPAGDPPRAADTLAALKADVAVKLSMPEAAGANAAVAEIPSLDAMVAKGLAHLDTIELPEVPDMGDVEGDLAAKSAKLTAEEAALRARGVNSPMLGMFALGHRLIAKAPRPADFSIDLGPFMDSLKQAKGGLLAQGVSLAALAPLTGLVGRMEALQAKMPLPPAPERRDHAYQELQGEDFNGQDLRGVSFARADLTGATFVGADLTQADLREAILVDADLSQATLGGARLDKADLTKARLPGASLAGAQAQGADFSECDLRGATLTEAVLEDAIFETANLVGANLAGANLIGADLSEADLSEADLKGARLEQAKAAKATFVNARLAEADLRFASLGGADLRGADLTRADLSIAKLDKVKADGIKLVEAKLDMTSITASRLQGAVLRGATSDMGSFKGTNLCGADLRDVTFHKVNFSTCLLEDADFEGASLHRADLMDVRATRTRFVKADLMGASALGKATFHEASIVAAQGFRSVWLGADLTRTDFSHAYLREAHFQNAHGERVNFFAADLKGAGFRKAKLTLTRFTQADLCGADLSNTTFLDTQFRGANCYDVKFLSAQLVSCDFEGANLNATQFDEGARP